MKLGGVGEPMALKFDVIWIIPKNVTPSTAHRIHQQSACFALWILRLCQKQSEVLVNSSRALFLNKSAEC